MMDNSIKELGRMRVALFGATGMVGPGVLRECLRDDAVSQLVCVERGRSMWARVKGATENALLRLPFKAAYMFRPGVIEHVCDVPRRRRPA